MSQHRLPLPGCAAEPLMSYLKSLGVLRLVSEQADPEACGCWCNDVFVLYSEFDPEKPRDFLDFFLERYQPTPLVAPWGARSGFYAGSSEKKARQALDVLTASQGDRFKPFRDMVTRVQTLLRQRGISKKAKDEEKLALMVACRSHLPDDILPWLDTCYVLFGDDRRFPPLLGTGGNEGSGSYVSGFAQQLVACLVRREHDRALETALWGTPQKGVFADQTPGHFSPTAVRGVNATQGLEGSVATNPWDYVLALEGTCLWASGVVRRFGQGGPRMAAFPFTVNVSGVGSGSLIAGDGTKPQKAKRDIAEMWLPLWSRPSSLSELTALLAEGRASVGQRLAVTGVDMARAVAELGVDRGISTFRRTLFLMRNGQSFLAIPVGSINVRRQNSVELLRQLDPWLDSFRDACGDRSLPRFKTALRGIEAAIFEFCRYGGRTFFQAIVVALGRAERELALSAGKIGKRTMPPVAGLAAEWIAAANDNSREFEIALALAGIYAGDGKIGPLRSNLEPVVVWRGSREGLAAKWAEKDRMAVWNSSDLTANLAAVLRRRLMDAGRSGCAELPLAATSFASLGAVSQFLAHELDERRIEDLLWGLMLFPQIRGMFNSSADAAEAPPLPRAYALLKLLFLPQPLTVNGVPVSIKAEPAIVTLLTAGHVGEACRIAMRRLRASGLSPLPNPRSGGAVRDADWEELDNLGSDGQRLAAALLLPLSYASISRLRELITREATTEP
jgi:CRISPR-associated protein Csx17